MFDLYRANIFLIDEDLKSFELWHPAWSRAEPVAVSKYWNGDDAPPARSFSVRMLWSTSCFYVRFEAQQNEPLVVNDAPSRTTKAMNLWDRDVCEVFVAPRRNMPERYFEFEVAPTGEWLDVEIDATGEKRISDWNYASGMETAASIGKEAVISAIKLNWSAFEKKPEVGDAWRGNLFRCVGSGPGRGYLAWSPTMTETPDFHVPERFGEFVFVK